MIFHFTGRSVPVGAEKADWIVTAISFYCGSTVVRQGEKHNGNKVEELAEKWVARCSAGTRFAAVWMCRQHLLDI